MARCVSGGGGALGECLGGGYRGAEDEGVEEGEGEEDGGGEFEKHDWVDKGVEGFGPRDGKCKREVYRKRTELPVPD